MFEPEVFGSKYTVLKKVLVTLLGLFGAPRSVSAPEKLSPLCPPRYAPHTLSTNQTPNHPTPNARSRQREFSTFCSIKAKITT